MMIFAGVPIQERIAWRGPIVMNTDAEIQAAYHELRQGTFYKKRAPGNYRLAADDSDVPYNTEAVDVSQLRLMPRAPTSS